MKKKGSILIEPLIYMFIASLIIILCFNMLNMFMKAFKKEMYKNEGRMELKSTDIIIKSRINRPFITDVLVEKDKLIIKHKDIQENIDYRDEIFLEDNRLKIKYYEDSNRNNVILKNVEKVKFKEKNQLIYIKIILKQGGEKILVYEKE